MTEEVRRCRAELEEARKREATAWSVLARYDAANEQSVERVKALLAAVGAGGSTERGHVDDEGAGDVTGVEDNTSVGAGVRVSAASSRRSAAWTTTSSASTLSQLAALGEAIEDRLREMARLRVSAIAAFQWTAHRMSWIATGWALV